MNFQFANLTAYHWLWLVAALAVVVGLGLAARRRALLRFADHPLLPRIAPGATGPRPAVRAGLLLLALVAIVAGLSDPRWGIEPVQTRRQGADIVFVVDVSRSMLAEDATPNRLTRAKQFVADAVEEMAGDRVGLVDFAGDAAMRVPLTLNYGAFRTALDGLAPKASARGGSMLGDAIRMAGKSFVGDPEAGRAIVVLTDGEDMESYPVEAARAELEERGIRVYTVGIGDSDEGARIPVESSGGRTYLIHSGQEVWTKQDPSTLAATAEAGGGIYIPAGTAQINLGEVLQRSLADLERREQETSTVRRGIPRYQWPTAAAFALLIVEAIIPARRRRKEEP